MGILIKNGWVIDPANGVNEKNDVYVSGDKIVKVAPCIQIEEMTSFESSQDEVEIWDATDCWVVPGLIDTHVHLREPGFEYKEDIASGTRSAAKGGYTSICPMPNTLPAVDHEDTVTYILEKTKKVGAVNVLPIGAVTVGQKGEKLSRIMEMKAAGIFGLSEDGRSVLNAKLLREAMVLAKELDIPMMSHCEDTDLAKGGCMNEGPVSKRLGLQGISNLTEDLITGRDILIAKETGARLHLCHVSTEGSVELIRHAKKVGLPVTAEACPHHFAMTDEAVNGVDSNTKMNPPLRSQKDVDAIKKGLADGTIDMIATDHAPHSADEKGRDYAKAANGIVGLETAVPLTITYLVNTGILSPEEFVEKTSLNPAKLLKIDKGTLGVGTVADLAIINPTEVYKIDAATFETKGRNMPFQDWEVSGKVKATMVSGKFVYTEEKGIVIS